MHFTNLCHVKLFYGFEDFEIGVVLMVNWARFDFQIFQGKYLVMLVISIFMKYAHKILWDLIMIFREIIYAIGKMWIFELMDLGVGGFENHGIYGMDYKEIVENFPVQADGLCPLCL